MKNIIYNNLKTIIKDEAKQLKATNKNDKIYVRTVLNDLLNELCKILNQYELRETISPKQNNLYQNWLTKYTIKLHP